MRNSWNSKENFIKIRHFIPQAAMCLALILCLSACGAPIDESKEKQAEAVTETAEGAGQEVPAVEETTEGAGQEVPAATETTEGAGQEVPAVEETAESAGKDASSDADGKMSAGQPETSSNKESGQAARDSGGTKKEGRPLIGAFETLDLDGSTVTEDIFSGADVTFINVWGTFCPPCIGEMPELEKIHQELPDNMQMIGILFDVKSQDVPQYPKAIKIVDETGVTYPSLIGNESMTGFLRTVHAVPTSFFVDSSGCIIGSPVVGADPDAYRMRLKELEKEYGKD